MSCSKGEHTQLPTCLVPRPFFHANPVKPTLGATIYRQPSGWSGIGSVACYNTVLIAHRRGLSPVGEIPAERPKRSRFHSRRRPNIT